MKTYIIYLVGVSLLIVTLSSCLPTSLPAQTKLRATNPQATVELLFEVDGCKVYRFYDQVGNPAYAAPRYFTKCQNGSSSVGWLENCGKNCFYYAENVTSYDKHGLPPIKP